MSTNYLSTWLTEGINIKAISEEDLSQNGGIALLNNDAYGVTYSNSGGGSEYSNYTNTGYSDYGNNYNDTSYHDYSVTYSEVPGYLEIGPPPYDDEYHVYYYNYSNYNNTASITTNPISQCIELGNQVTFSVVVSNSSVVTSYQWYEATTETGSGTPINGATSSSYQFIPSIEDDNKYYYCIATAPGGTVTSGRALLTIKFLKVYDLCLTVDDGMNLFIPVYPEDSSIEAISTDSNIASVDNNGLVTGISEGITQITICSNDLSKTAIVRVLPAGNINKLDALFTNLSLAIKTTKNITDPIKPDQMYNALKSGSLTSKSYNNLGELLSDIASLIKTTDLEMINPKDFYSIILSKNI